MKESKKSQKCTLNNKHQWRCLSSMQSISHFSTIKMAIKLRSIAKWLLSGLSRSKAKAETTLIRKLIEALLMSLFSQFPTLDTTRKRTSSLCVIPQGTTLSASNTRLKLSPENSRSLRKWWLEGDKSVKTRLFKCLLCQASSSEALKLPTQGRIKRYRTLIPWAKDNNWWTSFCSQACTPFLDGRTCRKWTSSSLNSKLLSACPQSFQIPKEVQTSRSWRNPH